MFFALTLFLVACILIAFEKADKILVALFCAVIFMVFGFVEFSHTSSPFTEYVDWNVIFLLIGIMLMVGVMKKTGLFEFIAIYLSKLAKGNPKYILLILFLVTGIFSAFIDSVAIMIIMTQISILIAMELGISPLPFVITQIIASSIGGTATLIGDPPNIMVGSAAQFSFLYFFRAISLFVLFNLVVSGGVLYFLFRKQLIVSNERRARIMEFNESALIHDKGLLRYALIVFGVFILLLFLEEIIHLQASTIALMAAVAMLVRIKRNEIEGFIHSEIEWGTILFFISLFVMVGGLVHTGLIAAMSQTILQLTSGSESMMSVAIVWTSGIGSALFNNIPFTAALIPMIENLSLNVSNLTPMWWALILGACFGGNGTLIATSSNLIAADICKKNNCPISFFTFFKYGALITAINLVLSTGFILWRFYS
jgi:Na+/H+ antiporter NhaD/arsenite permease-like protein